MGAAVFSKLGSPPRNGWFPRSQADRRVSPDHLAALDLPKQYFAKFFLHTST